MIGLFPHSGFLWAAPSLVLILVAWLWFQERKRVEKGLEQDVNQTLLIGGLLAACVSFLLFLGYIASIP